MAENRSNIGKVDQLAIDVSDESKISKTCKKCIFRVPKVLRRQNPEAYTPDVVTLGPFHYRGKRVANNEDATLHKGEEDFLLMERVKESYLNEILLEMNISLKELIAKVIEISYRNEEGEFEQRARGFYSEPFGHTSSEDFIEMMVVDGCFLVQLFRKCNTSELRAFDDPTFNMDCMFHFLCHDILLLENQLPWFVIQSFYELTSTLYPDHETSLSILILKSFIILPSLNSSCSTYNTYLGRNKHHCDDNDVLHLHILDMVRASMVIPLKKEEERAHMQQQMHPLDQRQNSKVVFDPDHHQKHTATALAKAYIKFESVTRESIPDIRLLEGSFRSNGVLQIPQLNVGMSSETLFRNLIAIEQCYHGYVNVITS